jgi:TPR repeat protein
MRFFLVKHGMELLAQQFHAEGYVHPEDVMDMDVEDVGELNFLNAAQKENLLQVLELHRGAGTNTAHQMVEESLQRENQLLQEQLYDLKGASGHEKSQMEAALSSAQAMQQKAEAESTALTMEVAAKATEVKAAEDRATVAETLLQKTEVETAMLKTEVANKVAQVKASESRAVEAEAKLALLEQNIKPNPAESNATATSAEVYKSFADQEAVAKAKEQNSKPVLAESPSPRLRPAGATSTPSADNSKAGPTMTDDLLRAAHSGDPTAQCVVGYCFAAGKGVQQNWGEALRFYNQAAEQGHPNAQYNLGTCYAKGRGVRLGVDVKTWEVHRRSKPAIRLYHRSIGARLCLDLMRACFSSTW